MEVCLSLRVHDQLRQHSEVWRLGNNSVVECMSQAWGLLQNSKNNKYDKLIMI